MEEWEECSVLVEGAVQSRQVGVCKGIGWLPFCQGNGGTGSSCGVNDSVGGSYFRDWDGMMLGLECVGDPLAACVSHED